MINLAGRPHFFVRAAMGLGIEKAVNLAIGKAILTETDITISFSELFL